MDWDSLSIPGPEICRQIRLVKTTPIIIVTDNISSKDCVAGLQAGADDYIRKPFAKEELVARVQAILRRSDCNQQKEINFFSLKISLLMHLAILLKRWQNLSLTKREYDLLVFLIKNKNTILSREMILNQVWGYNIVVNPNVVDLYIGYVRKS